MNYGVVEQKRSSSDARWWKTNPSLAEIADHLGRALADKQALEHRLAELLEENIKLSQRCSEATSALTEERQRSEAEIADLRSQVADGLKRLQDKSGMGGRQQAVFAARERLIKDEYERKTQALQLEFNKERYQHTKRMRRMEQDMAGCICRHVKIEHAHVENNVEHNREHNLAHDLEFNLEYNLEYNDVLAAELPPGWKIRNSK